MHLPLATATLVALAARVLGQTADFDPIYQPPAWATLISGSRFQIVWDAPAKYAGQTVTISLIGGDTQDTQTPIRDIASECSCWPSLISLMQLTHSYSWRSQRRRGLRLGH
jgi:hypothetical protein